MHEEAPPPIVRTRYVFSSSFILIKKDFLFNRVIKVDRPMRSGYSQPGSPYGNPCGGLPTFSNGVKGGGNPYRTHSVLGSVGRPVAYHNVLNNDPSFSSGSSYEYPAQQQPPTMMMMPSSQQVQPVGVMHQQQVQPVGVMHQPQVQQMGMMPHQQVQHMGMMQQQPVQQQVMYRPLQMQSSMPQMTHQPIPPLPSPYVNQNYMFSGQQGMSFGYHPMMQQGGMVQSGMPMMATGNTLGMPATSFPSQPPMFNRMPQQLVY
jgi:hypothetical protein